MDYQPIPGNNCFPENPTPHVVNRARTDPPVSSNRGDNNANAGVTRSRNAKVVFEKMKADSSVEVEETQMQKRKRDVEIFEEWKRSVRAYMTMNNMLIKS